MLIKKTGEFTEFVVCAHIAFIHTSWEKKVFLMGIGQKYSEKRYSTTFGRSVLDRSECLEGEEFLENEYFRERLFDFFFEFYLGTADEVDLENFDLLKESYFRIHALPEYSDYVDDGTYFYMPV